MAIYSKARKYLKAMCVRRKRVRRGKAGPDIERVNRERLALVRLATELGEKMSTAKFREGEAKIRSKIAARGALDAVGILRDKQRRAGVISLLGEIVELGFAGKRPPAIPGQKSRIEFMTIGAPPL